MDKLTKETHMDEGEIREALVRMEHDAGLLTERGYADALFPDEVVSFVEKHVAYLHSHPKINPKGYLANLRTMIKIRR